MYHLLWLKLKREKTLKNLNYAEPTVKKSTLRLEKLHKSHIGKTVSTVDQMHHLLCLKLKREKTLQNLNYAEPTVKKSTLRLEKLHKSHIGKTVSTVDQMHHLLCLKFKITLQISNGAQMRVTEWSS